MKIRARISAKLKDQSGASITYALLLFLVCAVVSSVVLAAGTAASGRMSKSVDNDQRYYAVTSAAELLKNQLDGKTWIRKQVTVGESSTIPLEGRVSKTDLLYVISLDALSALSAKEAGSEKVEISKTFTITPIGYEDFKVDVEALTEFDSKISEDPVLKLNLKNQTNKDKDTFNMWLVFTSDVEDSRVSKESSGGTSKSITVDKVNWNLYSISTEAPA